MNTVYWGDVPNNFGDVLTGPLLKHYGVPFIHTNNHEMGNMFVIGSIARLAKRATVLGSGIIRKTEQLDPNNTYYFVRGPLTRQRVLDCGGECPEIYGDAALLLPRFCPPVEKKHKIGFVPHYENQDISTMNMARAEGWHFIDVVNNNPLRVAKEISSCDKIVATSLHGIIAAHAYGIPAKHITKGKKLHGDGSKFKDYYASVGLDDDGEFRVPHIDQDNLDLIESMIKRLAP